MRSLVCVVSVPVLFAALTANAEVQVKESDLFGKWVTKLPNSTDKLIGVYEFKKMGLVTCEVKHLNMKVDANWNVEGDTVIMKVKTSSVPKLMPAGSVSRTKVIEISKSEIATQGKSGTVIIWQRIE